MLAAMNLWILGFRNLGNIELSLLSRDIKQYSTIPGFREVLGHAPKIVANAIACLSRRISTPGWVLGGGEVNFSEYLQQRLVLAYRRFWQ